MTSNPPPKPTGSGKRGFASMSPEKRIAIARKGGQSVPNEKRSFSLSAKLAKEAGAKGGKNVAPDKRAYALDNDLALQAAQKAAAKRSSKERGKF
jgi:general stress protein YciG